MLLTVVPGGFSPSLPASRLCNSRLFNIFARRRTVFVSRTVRDSPAAVSHETKPEKDPVLVVEKENRGEKSILACPICFNSLAWVSLSSESVIESAQGALLQCVTCMKNYSGCETHLDLTVTGASKQYGEQMPLATELFRFPLVSFLYERGWRQSFIWGGFPGPEREFEMAKDYLKPVLGGKIIDASCGSGMFSRLFARSELFSQVIALDYSENMLRQCREFINQEENFPKEKIILVRADISRLPFLSGSVDAVHAGAALHCWPSPASAVAEISRVLRPGGIFVATTFINEPLNFIPFSRNIRQEIMRYSGSNVFLREGELEDICRACGLVGFSRVRNGPFIMLSAEKPK